MCKVVVRYQILWKGSFGHKVLTVSLLFIIIYFNYGHPCVFQMPGMFFLWNSICIDDPGKEKCAWAHAAWNDARCGQLTLGGKRIFQEWHQHPPQNGTWDVYWKARKKSCVWKPLSFERPTPTATWFPFSSCPERFRKLLPGARGSLCSFPANPGCEGFRNCLSVRGQSDARRCACLDLHPARDSSHAPEGWQSFPVLVSFIFCWLWLPNSASFHHEMPQIEGGSCFCGVVKGTRRKPPPRPALDFMLCFHNNLFSPFYPPIESFFTKHWGWADIKQLSSI